MATSKVIKLEYYTMLGEQDFIDKYGYPVTSDELKAYAKTLFFEDGRIQHYIRQNKKGDPYNPVYDGSPLVSRDVVARQVKYRKVDRDTFKTYKLYLKKKNQQFYNEVMRRCV